MWKMTHSSGSKEYQLLQILKINPVKEDDDYKEPKFTIEGEDSEIFETDGYDIIFGGAVKFIDKDNGKSVVIGGNYIIKEV